MFSLSHAVQHSKLRTRPELDPNSNSTELDPNGPVRTLRFVRDQGLIKVVSRSEHDDYVGGEGLVLNILVVAWFNILALPKPRSQNLPIPNTLDPRSFGRLQRGLATTA